MGKKNKQEEEINLSPQEESVLKLVTELYRDSSARPDGDFFIVVRYPTLINAQAGCMHEIFDDVNIVEIHTDRGRHMSTLNGMIVSNDEDNN